MTTKTTRSFNDFSKKLSDFGIDEHEFKKIVDSVAVTSGNEVLKQVKTNPPFVNRTGLLTASQTFRYDDSMRLIFENEAKSKNEKYYGVFLHDGTKFIKAMKWFPKEWTKELPTFIKNLVTKIDKEFNL